MSDIRNALNLLNDRLVIAHTIGESFGLAGGENAPAWVYVYQTQIESIRQASEALETLLLGDGGNPHVSEAQRVEGYPSAPPTVCEAFRAVDQAQPVDQAECLNVGHPVVSQGPSHRHEKPAVTA